MRRNASLLLLLAGSLPARPEGEPSALLVIPPVGRHGRSPFHRDAIEARIVAGDWTEPRAGETVALPGGSTRAWSEAALDGKGRIEHPALRGGYACLVLEAEEPGVRFLHARGHSMVYVNGEPRAGDPYDNGTVRLPIALRGGRNTLLFHCVRGALQVETAPPDRAISILPEDATLPDLIAGEEGVFRGAVVVANATEARQEEIELEASLGDGPAAATRLPPLEALSVRKVGFRIEAGPEARGERPLRLALRRAGEELHRTERELIVRGPGEAHRRTFVSALDGSVQEYSLLPALRPGNSPPAALVLTLHGAGVDALGQVRSYAAKGWAHIVAPTNRRPFGFDWEDWGRLDALEVLEEAASGLEADPSRVHLTGHSMGGHGVWHLGVHFPDRFAALGPSAGWISFRSYARAPEERTEGAIGEILDRAAAPSDTLGLLRNTAPLGIYVLHGDADDNVPVAQARAMKEELARFHPGFVIHEEKGAGHWWDRSEEAGVDCVDWAPMFDLFARRVIPPLEAVRSVDFTTVNPAVSAWCHWAGIEAQETALKPSRVEIRCDPAGRRFSGRTENVLRLALRIDHLAKGAVRIELDGERLEEVDPLEGSDRLRVVRSTGGWRLAAEPSPSLKGPHRSGPFKEVFRNRVAFVYGTKGTGAENAWARAKARYDAETFWYRGNASVDLLPDTAFDPGEDRDRNVVLYGNAGTNAAWPALLGGNPVQVTPDGVRIGERLLEGADLACLFLRPRPGSERAAVGAISGTGLAGMRLCDRLPVFVSGVAYPDIVVLGPEALSEGAAGVRAAGFFGPDWSVGSGEIALR